VTRLAALDLPRGTADTLAPLCRDIDVLDRELAQADRRFATLVTTDPVVQRLTTVPGIGPITATAFVAAVDNLQRSGGRRETTSVASYLGLVPVNTAPVSSSGGAAFWAARIRTSRRCSWRPRGGSGNRRFRAPRRCASGHAT
jgi:transposase